MARFTPIIVMIDHVPYKGDYELVDGEVRVGSAYGSVNVRSGRADPDKAARAALQDLVMAYLKAR